MFVNMNQIGRLSYNHGQADTSYGMYTRQHGMVKCPDKAIDKTVQQCNNPEICRVGLPAINSVQMVSLCYYKLFQLLQF